MGRPSPIPQLYNSGSWRVSEIVVLFGLLAPRTKYRLQDKGSLGPEANSASRRIKVQSLLRYLVRLYCTLRHLSLSQAAHLVRSRLGGRHAAPKVSSELRVRLWKRPWSSPHWRSQARKDNDSITFLNSTFRIGSRSIWADEGRSRLWQYNLHYLDDLDAIADSDPIEVRSGLLDEWILNNPPSQGTGWEPYPLSLRIVNIIKFVSSSTSQPHWDRSLALQAQSLVQQIEWHIRANHLFENGKALVFAGSYFEGFSAQHWLRTGLEILDSECDEQFLPDGGHFELSPMYHGAMLWNLCDLLNLAETSGLPELLQRVPTWQRLLRKGLFWYAAMTHPDGGIAFFNDSALGVSPSLRTIAQYAATLNILVPHDLPPPAAPRLVALDSSGYMRVELAPQSVSMIDVARVGPDYQPGHAHADTLSFELSLFGNRVLVNSGTSTYERGPERDSERGTAAHNTVAIDGRNSSDTWSAFRVGRRALPKVIDVRTCANRIEIRAEHNGYTRLFGGARHVRHWAWTASSLQVIDEIVGSFRHAAAYYHVHPSTVVRHHDNDERCVLLHLPHGHLASFRVAQGRVSLRPSVWHPEFGRSVESACIVVEFTGKLVEALICWQGES